MYIDSIRVYQTNDTSAHVGNNHTLGCDPPEYPTKDFIRGMEYEYMRAPPFGYYDKHPLKVVQNGGGPCETDRDCGSHIQHENLTEVYEGKSTIECNVGTRTMRGTVQVSVILQYDIQFVACKCNKGFTGPHCLAQAHFDESRQCS